LARCWRRKECPMIADHVVDQSWRHAQADALESQIEAIAEALSHIANVEELLEARRDTGGGLLSTTRALAALYRDLSNELRDEALALRAAGRE
jgi:hypothetical protein